jgi:GGDEF domain-containing protein
MFLQVSTYLWLSVYTILNFSDSPINVLWYAVAVFLGIFGAIRQLPASLLSVLVAVISYGFYILVGLYGTGSLVDIGWNELLWLCVFPFIAIISGLNREERLPRLQATIPFGDENEKADGEGENIYEGAVLPAVQVALLGYGNYSMNEFQVRLQKLTVEGVAERFTFSLLLVEIESFHKFQREYGEEQAQYLLDKIAALMNDAMPLSKLKAYMEKGMFAVVLLGTDGLSPYMAMMRLESSFEAMLLSRSRRDGVIRVKLKFGHADFPIHGTNAQELLQKAAQQLNADEKEAK